MICQACGNHPAIVHLEELSGGKRVHLWLCMECAEKRKTSIESDGSGEDGLPAGDDLDLHSDSPFASFFGQVLKSERFSEGPAAQCPACGFSLEHLGRTNRLGCPGCYEFFRPSLVPILSRLHRHSSHLGKVPGQSGIGLSPEGEIAQHRVLLEKAIVAENFEDAARLRDLILRLEGLLSQKIGVDGSADALPPDESSPGSSRLESQDEKEE